MVFVMFSTKDKFITRQFDAAFVPWLQDFPARCPDSRSLSAVKMEWSQFNVGMRCHSLLYINQIGRNFQQLYYDVMVYRWDEQFQTSLFHQGGVKIYSFIIREGPCHLSWTMISVYHILNVMKFIYYHLIKDILWELRRGPHVHTEKFGIIVK